MPTYRIVQLGCAKNQVDGEVMAGLLEQAGYTPAPCAEEAEVIVVNTCSFLESARVESIQAILEECEYKKNGQCRFLAVTGCLPQMHAKELAIELPEVDLFLGADRFCELPGRISLGRQKDRISVRTPTEIYDSGMPRILQGPSAYLKVAEGCSNHCGYCLIGDIRGKFRSRNPEDILTEAARLYQDGFAELCLIAQDTTRYGDDLTPQTSLVDLLRRLLPVVPDRWLRLHYLYPNRVEDGLLHLMAEHPELCSYLDVPIQHAADKVLGLMKRPADSSVLKDLVERARRIVPDIALRSTVIVGHPGEGEAEFESLLSFVEEARIEHLGVFPYSPEEGTASALLPDQVPAEVAEERFHQVMQLQAGISQEINEQRVGEVYRVLIERPSEEYPDHYEGRTYFQAPDVDGVTLVEGKNLVPGTFADVRIVDATCYDLAGSVVIDGE